MPSPVPPLPQADSNEHQLIRRGSFCVGGNPGAVSQVMSYHSSPPIKDKSKTDPPSGHAVVSSSTLLSVKNDLERIVTKMNRDTATIPRTPFTQLEVIVPRALPYVSMETNSSNASTASIDVSSLSETMGLGEKDTTRVAVNGSDEATTPDCDQMKGVSLTARDQGRNPVLQENYKAIQEMDTANATGRQEQHRINQALISNGVSIPKEMICGVCHIIVENPVCVPWDKEHNRPACYICITSAMKNNGFVCPMTHQQWDVDYLRCLAPNTELKQAIKEFVAPYADNDILFMEDDSSFMDSNTDFTSAECPQSSEPIDLGFSQQDIQESTKQSHDSSAPVSSQGMIDEDGYFEVEIIVDARGPKNRREYYVKWKGFSDEWNTWEHANNLCDSAYEEAKIFDLGKKSEPISDEHRELLNEVSLKAINKLREMDTLSIFHNHVADDELIPPEEKAAYSSYIVTPVCIASIETKLKTRHFMCIEDVKDDVNLMFENCIRFNMDSESSQFYCKYAKMLRRKWKEEILVSLMRKVRGFGKNRQSQKGRGYAQPEKRGSLPSNDPLPNKTKNVSSKNKPPLCKRKQCPKSKNSPLKKRKRVSCNDSSLNKSTKRPRIRSSLKPRPKQQRTPQLDISCTESVVPPFGHLKATNQRGYDIETCIEVVPEEKVKHSFISSVFQNRSCVRKNANCNGTIEKIWHRDGRTYELVSNKVEEQGGGKYRGAGKGRVGRQHDVYSLYIATKGPNIETINLQNVLDNFCSFGSLGAKVCARLSHLQAHILGVCYIKESVIQIIPENGHEGCGFVPPEFFDGVEHYPHKRASFDTMQIRIIAPKVGLIKGLLLVKKGIDHIQIPSSMIKAAPSHKASLADLAYAAVIFKPQLAPSQTNNYHGRFLDPDQNPPNSYLKDKKVELSRMYQRMLLGFGVPDKGLEIYVKNARDIKAMKHTHLMGVTDPTGQIPYGQIFIPGYASNESGERDLFGNCLKHGAVFISRSPSVEPSDAKLLFVVKKKPTNMTLSDWDLLCSYRFGTVIFGSPKSANDTPIPCMVGDGDLDGDQYFVLWDEDILNTLLNSRRKLCVKARDQYLFNLTPPTKISLVNRATNLNKPYDKDWLTKAQDKMMDINGKKLSSGLVGKLYTLCSQQRDIYDEDAVAYAKAYKDAMDVQKHGGQIYLPAHLHENLPKNVRQLLLSD